MSSLNGLLCYCRQGFEPELAAELNDHAARADLPAYARTERNSGYALLVCETALPPRAMRLTEACSICFATPAGSP